MVFTVFGVLISQNAQAVLYDFNNGTGFDNMGIGGSMTVDQIKMTTVDIIGTDGTRSSDLGDTYHRTNIFSDSRPLSIRSSGESGNDAKDFQLNEAWVFNFDADVYLNEINFRGLGAGESMTLSTVSATSTNQVLVMTSTNESSTAGIWNLGDAFVDAGTSLMIQNTSEGSAVAIFSFTVEWATSGPVETINGTPYVWLDQFYEGLVTEEDYLIAEASDSDGDLLTAREEYVAGTVPTNATSVLKMDSISKISTNQVVSWQSVAGKYYRIIVRTNLTAVSTGWKTMKNNMLGLDGQTSVTSLWSTAASVFVKVGVEKRALYLLIGQSNMAGRAPIESEDEVPVAGCELFNSTNGWEVAANPLNQYSTIGKDISLQNLGPGYGFAQRLREVQPDIYLGLVVNARGGTSIYDWAKGADEGYYEAAVSRVREALKDGNSRFAGIIWHQGESNSGLTTSYLTRLSQLVADFRADFRDPDLPFVAGQLEQTTNERAVNEYILLLPTVSSNTAVATSENLTTIDGTHFDSASQRELGRRYADALLRLEE